MELLTTIVTLPVWYSYLADKLFSTVRGYIGCLVKFRFLLEMLENLVMLVVNILVPGVLDSM